MPLKVSQGGKAMGDEGKKRGGWVGGLTGPLVHLSLHQNIDSVCSCVYMCAGVWVCMRAS